MAKVLPIQNMSKRRLRLFSSTTLLALFLLGSIGQYTVTGEVTWLTSAFRWVEQSVQSVWRDPQGSLKDASHVVVSFAERATGKAEVNLSASIQGQSSPEPQISWSAPAYDLSGRVVRVADGDTLTVLDAENRQYEIRLHGIDTPEFGQPYRSAAKRALADRVAGEGVGIDVKDTDRYGRTVGVVYLGAKNINVYMVRSGYAWWYKKYAPFSDALREAERQARADGLGLWAYTDPIPPWEWRRR